MLKVSFEAIDNWNREEFREFIKRLKDSDALELFLITTSLDSALVSNVQQYLSLSSDNIIQCLDNSDKYNEIVSNAINIHFDNDPEFCTDLQNTTNPKIWGIYVSNFYNYYQMQMKYVYQFDFILKNFFSGKKDC